MIFYSNIDASSLYGVFVMAGNNHGLATGEAPAFFGHRSPKVARCRQFTENRASVLCQRSCYTLPAGRFLPEQSRASRAAQADSCGFGLPRARDRARLTGWLGDKEIIPDVDKTAN